MPPRTIHALFTFKKLAFPAFCTKTHSVVIRMESSVIARAMYSYVSHVGIKFEAGQLINVFEKGEDGWWWGEVQDTESEGWFPASYVSALTNQTVITGLNLPPNWSAFQTETGKTYYVNAVTKERTWSIPVNNNPPVIDSNQPTSKSAERKSLKKKQSFSTKRPSTVVRNSMTFPHPESKHGQTLYNPGQCSYCDFFWDDREELSGLDILIGRYTYGRSVCKEMADFVRERAIIEDVYAKSLAKLAASTYGDQEEGSLGKAWNHLKTKLQDEANAHQAFSIKLINKVQKPIITKITDEQKPDKKKHDQFKETLHEDRKSIASLFSLVEKARDSVAEKQKNVGEKEITAQQSSKALDKYEKAVKKTVQAGHEHRKAVESYNASQKKWVDDMVSACSELEKQEVDRVEFVKKQIMLYVFLKKEVNEICEKAMEEIVCHVDKVDAVEDRKVFTEKYGTGQLRPTDMS